MTALVLLGVDNGEHFKDNTGSGYSILGGAPRRRPTEASAMESADASSTITFKVLLVGDSGTGKSSILTRFTDDKFEPDHAATIGVDFKVKVMNVDNRTVKLTIWVRQTPPEQQYP